MRSLMSSGVLLQKWTARDRRAHQGFDELHYQFLLLPAADQGKSRKGWKGYWKPQGTWRKNRKGQEKPIAALGIHKCWRQHPLVTI